MDRGRRPFRRAFSDTVKRLCLAALLVVPALQAQSRPELQAAVSANQVYVEFALNPENTTQLDARLSQMDVTMLTWVVEIRRVVPGWHDQAIASSTVNVRLRPTGAGDRFDVVRRFNGQAADAHQLVDRQVAYQLVSSFRLPLFDVRQLDADGSYEVTIKAMLAGGREGPLTTNVLARTTLLR